MPFRAAFVGFGELEAPDLHRMDDSADRSIHGEPFPGPSGSTFALSTTEEPDERHIGLSRDSERFEDVFQLTDLWLKPPHNTEPAPERTDRFGLRWTAGKVDEYDVEPCSVI